MKLSIITVVKNDFAGVFLTIKSVIKQDFEKYEYIIIDGNSKDNTKKVILELTKSYKNIKYISGNDVNLYHALNKAIKIATGDFVGVLSGGDIYYDNYVLKKINKFLSNHMKTEILFGNLIYFNEYNIKRFWRIQISSKELKPIDAFKIPHSATFIKREILLKYLYDYKNYKISADTDFFLKIFKQKKINYSYLDQIIIFMKDGGISTSFLGLPLKFKEDIQIIFKYFKFFFIFVYFFKILIKVPSFYIKNKKQYYTFLIKRLSFLHKN